MSTRDLVTEQEGAKAPNECEPFEVLTARTSDVGGVPVARVLPVRQKRMIGPWCFFDHAGPVIFNENEKGMRVGPHPHTCLQTFTWMLEGELLHRDSLGHEQTIRPGQLNLMTAGHGISHTEESVFGNEGSKLHATQLWIALPKEKADMHPGFEHHPELPVLDAGNFKATVLAGNYEGASSPAKYYSPIMGIELRYTGPDTQTETENGRGKCSLNLNTEFEHGIMLLDSSTNASEATDSEAKNPGSRISVLATDENGRHITAESAQDELIVLPVGVERIEIQSEVPVRILLVGGKPFEKPVTIWWNFVGHSKEYITQAQEDWQQQAQRFGAIPNPCAERMEGPPVPWK